jgi:serine/threonine protein kinase
MGIIVSLLDRCGHAPKKECEFKNHIVLEEVGEGSEAKIFKARAIMQTFVIKEYHNKCGDYVLMKIKREMKILKSLQHECIIKFFCKMDTFKLSFEYVDGYDLAQFMVSRHNIPLSEYLTRVIFAQVISAIDHCHKNRIAHRDIKLDNIMVSKDNRVKLIDFGYGIRNVNECDLREDSLGTLHYCSPELLRGVPYNPFKNDVYCAGVCLYSISQGRFPFDDKDRINHQKNIDIGLEMDRKVSEDLIDLIMGMMKFNQDDRPFMREIVYHPWLGQKPCKT